MQNNTSSTMSAETTDEPPSSSSTKKPVNLLNKISNFFATKFGKAPATSLKDEIKEAIDTYTQESGDELEAKEQDILHNVVEFREVRCQDVMIPRKEIIAISINENIENIKNTVADKEHTRMPVYRDNMDNILGFIHIKDIIPYLDGKQKFKVADILREVIFAAPTMKAAKLLTKMQSKRTHIAIVVDEYGGTDGLVTIEDVLEEIVGEIDDEHDGIGSAKIIKIDKHTYAADAKTEIELVEQEFGLKLKEKDDDYDTIGGLIYTQIGKVPDTGEVIWHKSGLGFEITDADERLIKRIRIKTVENVVK